MRTMDDQCARMRHHARSPWNSSTAHASGKGRTRFLTSTAQVPGNWPTPVRTPMGGGPGAMTRLPSAASTAAHERPHVPVQPLETVENLVPVLLAGVHDGARQHGLIPLAAAFGGPKAWPFRRTTLGSSMGSTPGRGKTLPGSGGQRGFYG